MEAETGTDETDGYKWVCVSCYPFGGLYNFYSPAKKTNWVLAQQDGCIYKGDGGAETPCSRRAKRIQVT